MKALVVILFPCRVCACQLCAIELVSFFFFFFWQRQVTGLLCVSVPQDRFLLELKHAAGGLTVQLLK